MYDLATDAAKSVDISALESETAASLAEGAIEALRNEGATSDLLAPRERTRVL